MQVTEYMEAHGHEQLCVFTDTNVGLKAFIAIHDTTLGPALLQDCLYRWEEVEIHQK